MQFCSTASLIFLAVLVSQAMAQEKTLEDDFASSEIGVFPNPFGIPPVKWDNSLVTPAKNMTIDCEINRSYPSWTDEGIYFPESKPSKFPKKIEWKKIKKIGCVLVNCSNLPPRAKLYNCSYITTGDNKQYDILIIVKKA